MKHVVYHVYNAVLNAQSVENEKIIISDLYQSEMCLMMTEQEPSSTRIFNIPVKMTTENGQEIDSKLLIYTNDLAFDSQTKATSRRTPWLNQPTRNDTRNRDGEMSPYIAGLVGSATPESALMIVPIPNPTGTTEFGLVDIKTPNMKQFRDNTVKYCKQLLPVAMSYGARGFDSLSMNKSIQVHRVGNYDISVAPTFEDLENSINWKHFKLPADFAARKSVLFDQKLYPFPCAYVVAKAVTNIENDGFGVVFPNPGFDYFPTAHEGGQQYYEYDVNLYNFSQRSIKSVPFYMRGKQHEMHTYHIKPTSSLLSPSRASNFTHIESDAQAAITSAINSSSGKTSKLTVQPFQCINFTPIGSHETSSVYAAINQNVVLF